MMNHWKKALAAALVGLMAITAGCGAVAEKTDSSSGSSSAAGADKKYTIACDAKYAPFSMEVDGKYKGIDVELLDAIAKEEGFEYELKPLDFSGIIPALVSDQIDGAIAGMNITDERKQKVDFSDGYITSGLAVVVNKDNTAINKVEDLQGKTAAVKKGTTGAKFAEDNKDKYGLTINYYDDSPSMMLAVANVSRCSCSSASARSSSSKKASRKTSSSIRSRSARKNFCKASCIRSEPKKICRDCSRFAKRQRLFCCAEVSGTGGMWYAKESMFESK